MKRLFALMLICFLLACQPTPEATEHRQADNNMDHQHLSDAIPDFYEKEETLADEIRLKVKASVVKPDGTLSIGEIKRYPFDVSMVKRIGNVLWGNAPMYEYYEPKNELAEYIVACREQMEAAKTALSESDIAFIEMTLKDMEAAMPNAPDEGKPASYDRIFSYDNGFIKVDTGKGRQAMFQALSSEHRNILSFLDLGFKKQLVEEIEPLRVTEEDAIRQANEILDQLGFKDQFLAVKTGVHPINHTIVDELLADKGYHFPQRHERRYVIFMRKIGDAKQVYSEQIQYGSTDGGYDAAVFWEVMEFQFDNDGLVSFTWQEPGDVSITQENVSVIDLDTAYEAMLSYLKASQNQYTYESFDLSPERITISVDRIELGMSCILGVNRTIETVPVWEFFGEIEYTDAQGNVSYVNLLEHRLTNETRGCNSICTINALTGKRIDRGLGY
ncbi:MAG: hypothetical protein IKZ44_02200 [Clostridia bacterium]|nr:hypothetical protein [Clostridia bacterium]